MHMYKIYLKYRLCECSDKKSIEYCVSNEVTAFTVNVSNLNCQLCPEFKGWILPEVPSRARSGGLASSGWPRAAWLGRALNSTARVHRCGILPGRKVGSSVFATVKRTW